MLTPDRIDAWSLPGLLAGMILILLQGDGFLRLLRRARVMGPRPGPWEDLGLRLLLGTAGIPWIVLILDLAGIPIVRPTLAGAALLVLSAGFAAERPRLLRARVTPGHNGRLRGSPAAWVLTAAAASLVVLSFLHISLVPVRNYDALVGYDLVGKAMAYEGRFTSTVFTRIVYNAQCIYPPFTSSGNGFGYIWNPATPRFWVPVLAAGFLLCFAARLRAWTGSPTAAALAAFVTFLPSAFLFQLTVAQTDLPSMVFVALGTMAVVDLLRGRGGTGPPALFLLIATTARAENLLFGMALTAAVLLWPRRSGQGMDVPPGRMMRLRSLSWTVLPGAFFAFWNLYFVRNRLGYDPAAHFRSSLEWVPARAWEVVRRAVEIVGDPTSFGEFGLFVLGLPLLWIFSRIGEGRGWWRQGSGTSAGKPEGGDEAPHSPGTDLSGALLVLCLAQFVLYLPYFYMWDPELNPLWTMEHTYKRGFFRFIPLLVAAFVTLPPLIRMLRHCDRT